jgi:hypothetical protein
VLKVGAAHRLGLVACQPQGHRHALMASTTARTPRSREPSPTECGCTPEPGNRRADMRTADADCHSYSAARRFGRGAWPTTFRSRCGRRFSVRSRSCCGARLGPRQRTGRPPSGVPMRGRPAGREGRGRRWDGGVADPAG